MAVDPPLRRLLNIPCSSLEKRTRILDIGGKLRAVREARGLSQRDLAARAGLTNGAISQIEQNKSSPSVASLKRLLDAVQMTMSDFFSEFEDTGSPKYFYTAAEFTELNPKAPGDEATPPVSLRQLGNASQHSLQVLHETYPPGADTGTDFLQHEGEEAGVVVSGIIEIHVDDQVRVLNPGEGYIFDSRLPHRFRNLGDAPCIIVSACTPPSF